jgi:hypothetical protein
LLRRWQMPEVYNFVTLGATGFRSAEDTLRALMRVACQVTGARAAAIAVPRGDLSGLAVR